MESVSVTPTSDVETREVVGELAEELENFAFERERVLAKLDIRAAGLARRIARELRVVLRGLAVASDREAHEGVHETLGGLLEEAHRLLEGVHPTAVHAQPLASGSMPPAADASSRPPPSTGEDMSPAEDAPSADDVPLESGTRPIDGDDDVFARNTALDLETTGLPRVSDDPDDPEESPEDLTIARRVMWERSGNRILGR